MGKRTHRPYADEFKQEAVNLVLDQGLSRTQVARDLGISVDTLARWVRDAQGDAPAPPPADPPTAADLAHDGDSIPDEVLAQYMGGALDESQAGAVELALSQQPALLKRLVELRREVAAIREGIASGLQATPQHSPQGQILRMPRRTERPVTIVASRRTSGGQAS